MLYTNFCLIHIIILVKCVSSLSSVVVTTRTQPCIYVYLKIYKFTNYYCMAFELINALSSPKTARHLCLVPKIPRRLPRFFFHFYNRKKGGKMKDYHRREQTTEETFSTSNKCLCVQSERIFFTILYYIINYIMRKVTTHIHSFASSRASSSSVVWW